MVPKEEIAKINAAMERANGVKHIAAQLLGYDKQRLLYHLRKNPELNARWMREQDGKDIPTEASTLNREPQREMIGELGPPGANGKGSVISLTDEEVARAMERESARLRTGLAGLGLNPEELDIAMSLQAFHKAQFKESLEIIGASVTVTTIKLQSQQRRIEDRLAEVRHNLGLCGDYDPSAIEVSEKFSVLYDKREKWVKEEAELVKQYVEIGNLLRQNMEIANRGAMTMALIRHRFGKGGMKPAKPGFNNEPEPIEA